LRLTLALDNFKLTLIITTEYNPPAFTNLLQDEISQSELKYVNGGFGWLAPFIIGVATLIVPSTIGKDKNKNDNDLNKY